MVDIPERTESHGPVFIYGVEGEQIEEENDAYNDLRYDIGERREAGGLWPGSETNPRYMMTFPCVVSENNNQQFASRELIKQRKCCRPSQGLRGG